MEEQQSASQALTPEAKEKLNRERAEKMRGIQALKLNRARISEQLERTANDRYKELLQRELDHIDAELKGLE